MRAVLLSGSLSDSLSSSEEEEEESEEESEVEGAWYMQQTEQQQQHWSQLRTAAWETLLIKVGTYLSTSSSPFPHYLSHLLPNGFADSLRVRRVIVESLSLLGDDLLVVCWSRWR